jgi:hypothetical protein
VKGNSSEDAHEQAALLTRTILCLINQAGRMGKRLTDCIKAAVDRWTLAAGINAGPLFRSINKAGNIWVDGFTPSLAPVP